MTYEESDGIGAVDLPGKAILYTTAPMRLGIDSTPSRHNQWIMLERDSVETTIVRIALRKSAKGRQFAITEELKPIFYSERSTSTKHWFLLIPHIYTKMGHGTAGCSCFSSGLHSQYVELGVRCPISYIWKDHHDPMLTNPEPNSMLGCPVEDVRVGLNNSRPYIHSRVSGTRRMTWV